MNSLGTVLAAGYLLWLFQRTAFGEPSEEFKDDPHLHDVTTFEWLAWTPFLVGIVLFGVAYVALYWRIVRFRSPRWMVFRRDCR